MTKALGRIAAAIFFVTCLIFDLATCLLILVLTWGVQ